MLQITQKNNFIYLFIALVSLLFSMAFMKQTHIPWLDEVVEVIILSVLVLGVHSLKSDRSWMWAVYFMAFIMFISFIFRKVFGEAEIVEYLHLLLLLSFFIGSFYLSVKQIVMSMVVDQNMIVGSIVLYLLLGLMWTIIYLLLLNLSSDSFTGLESLPWKENFSHVAYFSFVTLTTLGYGDISPKDSLSEFFVYAEAIVGIFYMAIIVSSLVAARIETFNKERDK